MCHCEPLQAVMFWVVATSASATVICVVWQTLSALTWTRLLLPLQQYGDTGQSHTSTGVTRTAPSIKLAASFVLELMLA